jgi:hypothetical protein
LEKSFTVFGPVKTRVIAWKRENASLFCPQGIKRGTNIM